MRENKILIYLKSVIVFLFIHQNSILGAATQNNIICNSDACQNTATLLKSVMDFSVDPCDNFYKFSCGKFAEFTKDKHKDDESYSWVDFNGEMNDKKFAEFFKFDKPSTNAPETAKKIQTFYQSCIDKETMNKNGVNPIRELLKKVGLSSSPPTPASPLSFNWYETAAKMKKQLNQEFLFSVKVIEDYKEEGEMYLSIGKPDTYLPFVKQLSHYSNYDIKKNEEKVKKYIYSTAEQMYDTASFNSAGQKDEIKKKARLEAFTQSVYQTGVDRYTMHEDAKRDGSRKVITIDELQKFTDFMTKCISGQNNSVIDWKNYFTALYENVGDVKLNFEAKKEKKSKKAKKSDKIIVSDIAYLRRVFQYIAMKNVRDLQYAMWFDVVAAIAPLTTDQMRKIDEEFLGEKFTDAVYWEKKCQEYVKSRFEYAVLQYIAADTEISKIKHEATEYLSDFKAALANIINEVDWVDPITKGAAMDKIKKMSAYISFPDKLLNDTVLELLYGPLFVDKLNFLSTVLALKEKAALDNLKLLRKSDSTKNTITVPEMDLLIVNAFYDPTQNRITIPMGILQVPNFGFPLRSLNYGAISATIGHEITHGFDSSGISYDAYGNETDWWEEQSLTNYKSRAQCFVDSYSSIEVHGMKVNGEETVTENIADNGGFSQGIRAYRQWVKVNQEEPLLPGFENFTHEQLAVLGFAVSWCDYLTEDMLYLYMGDVHAPNEARVTGTLMNSQDFADIWHCKKGSKMNKEEPKCKIW